MIKPETLRRLTTYNHKHLAWILADSGYSGCCFKQAEFLGLNADNQFAYKVVYHDESGTGETIGRVFVMYDTVEDRVTADF